MTHFKKEFSMQHFIKRTTCQSSFSEIWNRCVHLKHFFYFSDCNCWICTSFVWVTRCLASYILLPPSHQGLDFALYTCSVLCVHISWMVLPSTEKFAELKIWDKIWDRQMHTLCAMMHTLCAMMLNKGSGMAPSMFCIFWCFCSIDNSF